MSEPAGYQCVLMRGGTSKGLFFHRDALPPPGPARDALLSDVMGCPDVLQLDGLGGGTSSTSKVMVVGPRDERGRVPYEFGQVEIGRSAVDWSGNCGNLTTAVALFAVESRLVPPTVGWVTVSMVNVNTGVEVLARLECDAQGPMRSGDCTVAGVRGSAAPIETMYGDAEGAVTGQLLPTGATQDELSVQGRRFKVSIVDFGNLYCFAEAADFNLDLRRAEPAELNTNSRLLDGFERLRAVAAVQAGRASSPQAATEESPVQPRLILLEGRGRAVACLGVSLQRVHNALMMTGALCVARAASIPGSVVSAHLAQEPRGDLTLITPAGDIAVRSNIQRDADGEVISFRAGFSRTARTLMSGHVYPRRQQ